MLNRAIRALKSAYRELRGQYDYWPYTLNDPPTVAFSNMTGLDLTPEMALRQAAVFSCVRVLSESVGQLSLHLYRDDADGDRQPAKDHPLYYLMHDAPNALMTAYRFKQMHMTSLNLRGNAYAEIIRNKAGEVESLWPWHPDHVKTELNGWNVTYKVRDKDGKEFTRYPARPGKPSQVLHVRGLSLNGVLGLSPIEAACETVGLSVAINQYAAKFFRDGASPNFVISYPGTLTDTAHKNLSESFAKQYAGLQNAHEIPVLEEGAEPKALGISPEDSQLLDSRKLSVREIASIFRVPPHMIGDLERATFSNIEQQSLEYVMYSLMPWLVNIEQELNATLLLPNEREFYFKFKVDSLLRGDKAARMDAHTKAIQWGMMSPNEARKLEDLNRREGGDEYLTPSNMLLDGKLPVSLRTDDGDEKKEKEK